jgi:hypothetical protein
MTQEELRKVCKKYFWCESIEDCQALLDIYINFMFDVVLNHDEEVFTQAEADAKILLQMMMTKALHLKKALDGIGFQSKSGRRLNNIIDPTVVASLIRNIYETTGAFNLIYRSAKNVDETKLIYLLWVHAGLAYRQRFDELITQAENKEKSDNEKAQIEAIKKTIEENELFKKLDDKNQGKIRTRLKEKDFLLRFNNLEVEFLSWRELVKSMEIKDGKLDHAYTYFSLYSHPSNVSVFQFADMFAKNTESYRDLVTLNLHIAFMMFSIFIADFIKVFPVTLKTYEAMALVEQIVINFHNTQARGHQFDINEVWTATG